jgi:hypothetical protein
MPDMGAAWRWLRDHPIWGILGATLSVVALALWAVDTWAPQWLHGTAPIAIAEKGDVGPTTVKVNGVECGKALGDLSDGFRDAFSEYLPEGQDPSTLVEGQLCLAEVEIRNNSDSQLALPQIWGTLLVGDGKYESIGLDQAASNSIYLFPRGSKTVTYIFEIASQVTPTELKLSWTEPDKEDSITITL